MALILHAAAFGLMIRSAAGNLLRADHNSGRVEAGACARGDPVAGKVLRRQHRPDGRQGLILRGHRSRKGVAPDYDACHAINQRTITGQSPGRMNQSTSEKRMRMAALSASGSLS